MCEYIWKKSEYRLFKDRWGIAISLEAGYQILSNMENKNKYLKVTEKIYFYPLLLTYPDSQSLTAEEQIYFCNGLNLVSDYMLELLPDGLYLITLRSIQFSDCYVQNEGFTACAIQWASEIFKFPMPVIKVHFDSSKRPCGKYIFDFSLV